MNKEGGQRPYRRLSFRGDAMIYKTFFIAICISMPFASIMHASEEKSYAVTNRHQQYKAFALGALVASALWCTGKQILQSAGDLCGIHKGTGQALAGSLLSRSPSSDAGSLPEHGNNSLDQGSPGAKNANAGGLSNQVSIDSFLRHCVDNQDNSEMVRRLIKQKANIHQRDAQGNTLLHTCNDDLCDRDDNDSRISRSRVENRAEVDVRNNNGETPLHYQIRALGLSDTVLTLLECKANINAQDNNGNTPLHAAWDYGECHRYVPNRLMSILLGKGADANLRNNKGISPLDMALASNAHDLFSHHGFRR